MNPAQAYIDEHYPRLVEELMQLCAPSCSALGTGSTHLLHPTHSAYCGT